MPANQLQQIDDGLWCLESHFVLWGCNGSARMSLFGTPGGLVIYSPVRLSPAHINDIKRIGSVSAIIAPNLYHHMFLRPCMAAFPEARVFIPDGLATKIGPVPGAEVMTNATDLDAPGDIAHHVFAGHILRETVLFHRPTGTLITADLLYNFQPESFTAEKTFYRAIGSYGRPCVPFYHRFAIADKAAVRALIDTVSRWPVRRIVMCHGRIVEADNASELFADAWSRFA